VYLVGFIIRILLAVFMKIKGYGPYQKLEYVYGRISGIAGPVIMLTIILGFNKV